MHKANKPLKQYQLSGKAGISSSNSKLLLHLSLNANESISRECILFPTYAFRNPQDMDEWIVRTKGWAIILKKPGPKQKFLKGITKSVAGKSSNENEISNRTFENRFKYFLAKGKRNKEFKIEAISAEQCIRNHCFQTRSYDTSTDSDDRLLSYIVQRKNLFGPLLQQKVGSYLRPSCTMDSYDATMGGSSSSGSTANELKLPSPVNGSSVILTSEGAGIISGELCIRDEQVQILTCQGRERMIRIRSTSRRISNKRRNLYFPPGLGLVQLIDPKGISVISDIDDTIKDTKVLSGARMVLSNTFFKPTRAIVGMAEAYLDWYNSGVSFHYVSNSPFQLVHMLCQFIDNHHFPPGSFHLRPSSGLFSKLVDTAGRSKQDSIRQIIRDFPYRKFILVGDSAEIDLEIYTRIATEFPDQILKIFIRDLPHHEKLSGKKKATSFPSFFISNSHTRRLVKSTSCPNLDTITEENSSFDKDSDEEVNEAASKLAGMVLEPSLTGHDPIVAGLTSEGIPALAIPVDPRLDQLHTRINHARKLLKDIDIILFTEAKQLQEDKQIRRILTDLSDSNP